MPNPNPRTQPLRYGGQPPRQLNFLDRVRQFGNQAGQAALRFAGNLQRNNNAQGLAQRYGTTPNDANAQRVMNQVRNTATAAFGFATRNANNPAALMARYGSTPAGQAAPFSDIPQAYQQYFGPRQPRQNRYGAEDAESLRTAYAQPGYRPAPAQPRGMSQRALDAWAGRLNAQAADYFSRPVAPLPTTPANPYPYGGGYYGGGGGGGGYSNPAREYYNNMVNWAINQPDRGG